MKKSILKLALATTFIAGSVITGYHASAQDVDKAKEKVEDARKDLREAKEDEKTEIQKKAQADEWKAFKEQSESKIKNNEVHIAELKEKMNKPGTVLDPIYEKKINALEQRNKDMMAKINAYEKNQSNWEVFKREFNHDIDELGQALKDFTVNNKN